MRRLPEHDQDSEFEGGDRSWNAEELLMYRWLSDKALASTGRAARGSPAMIRIWGIAVSVWCLSSGSFEWTSDHDGHTIMVGHGFVR